MGKGFKTTSSGLVAGGLGSHLDAMQVDIMPMIDDSNDGKRKAVEWMVTRMRRWSDPQSSNAQVP